MGLDNIFYPVVHDKEINEQPAGLDWPATSWVFELADDGTVTYSRPHMIETGDGKMASLEGQNFFDGLLGFEDVGKCREHFGQIRVQRLPRIPRIVMISRRDRG